VGCGGGGETDPTPKPEKENAEPPKAEPKVEVKKPEPPKTATTKLITDPILEKAIREELSTPGVLGGFSKFTGELTKTDLKKVMKLFLDKKQLTDVKPLEKLTRLKFLFLRDNPDLTKAQIDELQKALPKCKIFSNPTK
jgi:hypothetical protein